MRALATDPTDPIYERLLHLATTRRDGTPDDPPASGTWDRWVEAGATGNWVRQNTLLDYLDEYGDGTFTRDRDREGYDKTFDVRLAYGGRGRAFKRAVLARLAELIQPPCDLGNLPTATGEAKRATLEAMARGAPIIANGQLWNPDTGTWAAVDLIVRSDVAAEKIPSWIADEPRADLYIPAPNLGGAYHYRVMSITWSRTPDFDKRRLPRRRLADAVRNCIANDALGRLQGFVPPFSYVLGVDWEDAGVAPIEHKGAGHRKLAAGAATWIRLLRAEGWAWRVLPAPTRPELRPNLHDHTTTPWGHAVQEIAEQLGDLTLLPFVNVKHRDLAHTAGITRWDDPRLSAAVLGLGAEARRAEIVDAVLAANRSEAGVLPAIITKTDSAWRRAAPVEAFAGIETVALPDGSRIACLISWAIRSKVTCGQLSTRWLAATEATKAAEADLIARWRAELTAAAADAGVDLRHVVLYRWGTAGQVPLSDLTWYDLLTQLVRHEPVTVKGARDFKLRSVADALQRLNRISCTWPDHPAGGQEAMAAAINASNAADGRPLETLEPIKQIAAFGVAHCQATAAILDYLRRNH
ncbi:MAG TPA: hypothetical protein VET26_04540 [Candidatus Sulfotelmatobacter sp.]|nr:hypothetical protein [Candidatus Sulfotelmatobacter sp.]